MWIFDLNCDMGESFGVWIMGDDVVMLKVVLIVNIVCGFYVGDFLVMCCIIVMVCDNGVVVGVYLFFVDFYGFGCRRIFGECFEDFEV